MQANSTFQVDGSQSYDEDRETGLDRSSVIFTWSCIQILPTFDETCLFQVVVFGELKFARDSYVTLVAPEESLGA